MPKAKEQTSFGCRVDPSFRIAVLAWAKQTKQEYASALRHLLCLGLGLSLDAARDENARQEMRRQSYEDGLRREEQLRHEQAGSDEERAAVSALLHKRPELKPTDRYACMTVTLSPVVAAQYRAKVVECSPQAQSETLRETLYNGSLRVTEFLPGGPFYGAHPGSKTSLRREHRRGRAAT